MEAANAKQRPLNERALHQLLDAVEALVALVDLTGKLVYVSSASRRLLISFEHVPLS